MDNESLYLYYKLQMKCKKFLAKMCTSNQPKVSVLVPVYNAAPFIAATVRAVLEQTFADFELILLDDASTDKSAEIIARFDDKRIVYARNERNLGISATRNKLAAMARGDYIAVLDHDDICLPERLETQVRFLDKHPDIAMAGSWFELVCPPQASALRRLLLSPQWIWCQPLRPTLDDAWRGNVVMHPTAMYRRRLFEEHGIRYDESRTPAEDYDLVRQALFAGLKLANIPQILLNYNLHGSNFSLRQKALMRRADRMIKEEIRGRLSPRPKFFYPYFLLILQKLRPKFLIGKKDV